MTKTKAQKAAARAAKKEANNKKQNLPSAATKSNHNGGMMMARSSRSAQIPKNYFRLSNCAEKYMASLIDPFTGPDDACMPTSPSIKSRRVKSWSRGIMTIGTAGYGFIMATPTPYSDGLLTGNGSATVYYSTSAFTLSACTTNAATTGVGAANTNVDYNFAGMQSGGTNNSWARLVSAGIRIRYTGTELNRGGSVFALEEPDHQSLATYTISNMQAFGNCHEEPADREWHSIVSSGPTAPGEFEFVQALNSTGTTAGVWGMPGQYAKAPPFLLLAVQGAAGNTFDYEYYQNWEYIGPNVQGKLPGESDDAGLSLAVGALRSTNDGQIDKKHPIYRSPKMAEKVIQDYASENTSGWVTTVADVAQTAGGALLAAPNPLAKIAGGALTAGSAVFSALFK